MSEQLGLLPQTDPDRLIAAVKREHSPIRTFCLFSGGADSLVVAHRCRDAYDELVFIDTGTALPGVEEHVVACAEWLDKPLRIMRHDHDAYRKIVLRMGFPGPAQHNRCYNRLKERQLERLLRETKAGYHRRSRVLALTGIRRAESQRRRARMPVTRKGALVFANPLVDWTDSQMREYRMEVEAPVSEVQLLTHRSCECMCLAFSAPGEREMIRDLWPEWFNERIAPLEREAEARGLPCRWGERPAENGKIEEGGELCSSCAMRGQMQLEAA